jgi:hypothetical protein
MGQAQAINVADGVCERACVGVAWGAQATYVGEALTLVPCFVSHQRTAVAWAEALQRLPNWMGGRHEAVLVGDHRPKRGAAQRLLSTRACLTTEAVWID